MPLPISDDALYTLPVEVSEAAGRIRHYFAENARTARRFLKVLRPELVMEQIELSEIGKHQRPDLAKLRRWLQAGFEVGVVSEAGCPGIADPGSIIVARAHEMGAGVHPLTGPSSLLLALMASGLNGQSFAFNGYLPVKEPDRGSRLRSLEQRSIKESQTQLFIETPYRNNQLLGDCLKHCQAATQLCIAQNLTSPDAYVKMAPLSWWKVNKPLLPKSPAIFLLLG